MSCQQFLILSAIKFKNISNPILLHLHKISLIEVCFDVLACCLVLKLMILNKIAILNQIAFSVTAVISVGCST